MKHMDTNSTQSFLMKNVKQKILIVEDDRYLSNVLNFELQKTGFDVVLSGDGREGLEKIKVEKPDLILLDLLLPMQNGFGILKAVQSDDELRKIPIIILSNLDQQSDIEKGKKMGAVDYLVKSSFSIKEVVEKIKGCLGEPRL